MTTKISPLTELIQEANLDKVDSNESNQGTVSHRHQMHLFIKNIIKLDFVHLMQFRFQR